MAKKISNVMAWDNAIRELEVVESMLGNSRFDQAQVRLSIKEAQAYLDSLLISNSTGCWT